MGRHPVREWFATAPGTKQVYMINFQLRPFFCVSVCLDTQGKLDQIRAWLLVFGTWEATVSYCTSQCRFLQGPRWSWVTYSGIPCPVLWSWPSKVNSKNWNPKPWIVPQIVPDATAGCLCGTQSLWRAWGFPTAMRFQPIYNFLGAIMVRSYLHTHKHPHTLFWLLWFTESLSSPTKRLRGSQDPRNAEVSSLPSERLKAAAWRRRRSENFCRRSLLGFALFFFQKKTLKIHKV